MSVSQPCMKPAGLRAGYSTGGTAVHSIIYLIGLIVVVLAVLSLLGLR